MEIKRSGSEPSRSGSPEWFTGSVRIDPLFQPPEPARVTGGHVTFEPDRGSAIAIAVAEARAGDAVLIVGSTATFPNDWSGFVQFSAAAGLQNESNYGVLLGIRKQF